MPVEWDIRASDTHLASPIDGAATTILLAHPRGPAGEGYPTPPAMWLTIAPDDPNEREEVLVTALSLSSASATVVRGVGYSSGMPHRAGTPVRLGTRAGAYPEDWRVISNFQNSWVAAGGSNPSPAYKRFPDGMVILRGTVQSGTVGTAAFTLPGGYRPDTAGQHIYAADGGTAYRRVDVATSGAVIPQSATPTGLDTIRFYAGA